MKREPFVCVLNKDCTVCNLEELHGEKGAFRLKKKKELENVREEHRNENGTSRFNKHRTMFGE